MSPWNAWHRRPDGRSRRSTPSENAVVRSVAMGIRARRGIIEAMAYGDQSFDAVFCSEVFEHLTPDQLQAALPEIGRVLTSDGRFGWHRALR
jgi:ubiquinone/menaquinone biosynthesis C-methylase UbiE